MRFVPSLKKYLILAAFLFSLIALPSVFIDKIRFKMMAALNPFSKTLSSLSKPIEKDKKVKALEIENHFLRSELAKWQNDVQGLRQKVISSQVIYRDPASWSSSFWIDKGEENNKKGGKKIIVKNCPVVYGKAVVGVIDYVGLKQSRVRLITDSGLKVSVRAARGHIQHVNIIEHIESLKRLMSGQKDLPLTQQDKTLIFQKFDQIKTHYEKSCESWYLAKGLIQGSGAPLWRKKKILRGVGFNYDFADVEGPARDLHSGTPLEQHASSLSMPLIQMNDLLVTTGMDGVFPKGLLVGTVTKVFPLKEGAYTFDIEALPFISQIDDLHTVFIMPAVGFELN